MSKSGFRRKKIYVLEFADDGEFGGLEVRMRPVTIGEMLEITAMADDEENTDLRPLFARFADSLVGWNIEDEQGNAIPADFGGVCSQDADMIMAIIGAWQDAITGKVSIPKEQPSSDGLPWEVGSIPMVV